MIVLIWKFCVLGCLGFSVIGWLWAQIFIMSMIDSFLTRGFKASKWYPFPFSWDFDHLSGRNFVSNGLIVPVLAIVKKNQVGFLGVFSLLKSGQFLGEIGLYNFWWVPPLLVSKTLLKLTIPRIKLLRNRKDLSLKQMRRDIAKLLENGQEATARIRVSHALPWSGNCSRKRGFVILALMLIFSMFDC